MSADTSGQEEGSCSMQKRNSFLSSNTWSFRNSHVAKRVPLFSSAVWFPNGSPGRSSAEIGVTKPTTRARTVKDAATFMVDMALDTAPHPPVQEAHVESPRWSPRGPLSPPPVVVALPAGRTKLVDQATVAALRRPHALLAGYEAAVRSATAPITAVMHAHRARWPGLLLPPARVHTHRSLITHPCRP